MSGHDGFSHITKFQSYSFEESVLWYPFLFMMSSLLVLNDRNLLNSIVYLGHKSFNNKQWKRPILLIHFLFSASFRISRSSLKSQQVPIGSDFVLVSNSEFDQNGSNFNNEAKVFSLYVMVTVYVNVH